MPSSPEDEDRILRNLGAELRIARGLAGLSQEEVAERTGLAQSSISAVESGQLNLSLRALMRLADAVDCHLRLHVLPTKLDTPEDNLRFARAVSNEIAPTVPADREDELLALVLEETQRNLMLLLARVNAARQPPLPERPRRGRRPKKRGPENG